MARDELADASDHLESAADETDSDAAAERLGELADQLDRLATADRGPDHGRLARIQSAIDEVRSGDGADVAEALDAADDRIDDYRADLEGV
ncbi:DUF7553 family protein [Haloarcula litorea]|uniref:DUF7553 family protein n=1 Tax=Haloarcula litorea TaxID=3032579 RepID=UPI0023E756D9|nr:hypothetical protein [Halomicroarcula sp. GDY20]